MNINNNSYRKNVSSLKSNKENSSSLRLTNRDLVNQSIGTGMFAGAVSLASNSVLHWDKSKNLFKNLDTKLAQKIIRSNAINSLIVFAATTIMCFGFGKAYSDINKKEKI